MKVCRRTHPTDGGLVPVILRLCKMRRLRARRIQCGMVRTDHGTWIDLGPAGAADALVELPRGQCGWIEAKAPGKKPNPAQLRFAAETLRMGGRYVVVWSAQEIIDTLDRWIAETQQEGRI